jgi:hypothetical protein
MTSFLAVWLESCMIIFMELNVIQQQYEQQAALFKLFTHPARLAILEVLRQGEACVCHLEAVLGFPPGVYLAAVGCAAGRRDHPGPPRRLEYFTACVIRAFLKFWPSLKTCWNPAWGRNILPPRRKTALARNAVRIERCNSSSSLFFVELYSNF